MKTEKMVVYKRGNKLSAGEKQYKIEDNLLIEYLSKGELGIRKRNYFQFKPNNKDHQKLLKKLKDKGF